MGHSVYLVSKDKAISRQDLDTAISNLNEFHRKGIGDYLGCSVTRNNNHVIIQYSFNRMLMEGFVLNLLVCFLSMDYQMKVISREWGYGTDEDWHLITGR
jgi:hypothetical protein